VGDFFFFFGFSNLVGKKTLRTPKILLPIVTFTTKPKKSQRRDEIWAGIGKVIKVITK